MADVSPAAVDAVRALIAERGASALVVDDLREGDLERIGWSGSALHVQNVGLSLGRRDAGELDYLAVRAPERQPIAKGAVVYVDPRGPGKIWQLATHPGLQGLGIGSALIHALEDRLRRRGLTIAWLAVEPTNRRARALYERLGYDAFDLITDGWQQQREDGSVRWYETELVLMRRHL